MNVKTYFKHLLTVLNIIEYNYTMDRLYTIKETYGLLKISRTKLYLLVREGKIEPVKLDGKTLFKESELNRFIDALKK